MQKPSSTWIVRIVPLAMWAVMFAAGCTIDEKTDAPVSQDKALRDPFGYGPDADLLAAPTRNEVDPTDISGGDIGTLNKKAINRDLKSVFDP